MRMTVMLVTMMVTIMVTMKATKGMVMVPGPPMAGVSVGHCGLWGWNATNSPFYRMGTYGSFTQKGNDWLHVDLPRGVRGFKQLAVGFNSVWAVTMRNQLYCRKGISKAHPTGTQWRKIGGSLTQISVSYNGQFWGVNGGNNVYIRTGISARRPEGTRWRHIGGQKLKHVTIGAKGVWGIDPHNNLWYRNDTFGGCNSVGTTWTRLLDMPMKYISSTSDELYGISQGGQLYKRMGMGMDYPMGKMWKQIMMESDPMGMVASVEKFLWSTDMGPGGAVHFSYMKGCGC